MNKKMKNTINRNKNINKSYRFTSLVIDVTALWYFNSISFNDLIDNFLFIYYLLTNKTMRLGLSPMKI